MDNPLNLFVCFLVLNMTIILFYLYYFTSKSRQNDNYLYFDSSRSDNNRLTKDRSTDLHQKSKVVKRVNLTKSSREKLNIDIAKMKILQFGRAPKLFRIFWAPIIFSATVLFFLQDTKKWICCKSFDNVCIIQTLPFKNFWKVDYQVISHGN